MKKDLHKDTKKEIAASREILDEQTGQIYDKEKFNKVIIHETKRADGSLRIQQDYSNCPTLAEQHTAHLTDINYLMERYAPDELAQYLAARNQFRREIVGHDFSQEPDMQEAKNVVYKSRAAFDQLPDSIKFNFKNHVEFLKFIDNPANAEKMVNMGLLTKTQLTDLQIPEPNQTPVPSTITQNQNLKQNQNSNMEPK